MNKVRLQASQCPNCNKYFKQIADTEYKYAVIHNEPSCPLRFEVYQDTPKAVNEAITSFTKNWIFKI